ncbi:hypothetical protein SARC_18313, partial [Sphaeroforma arctica JP610]
MLTIDISQYKSGEDAVEASVLMYNAVRKRKGEVSAVILNKGPRSSIHGLAKCV